MAESSAKGKTMQFLRCRHRIIRLFHLRQAICSFEEEEFLQFISSFLISNKDLNSGGPSIHPRTPVVTFWIWKIFWFQLPLHIFSELSLWHFTFWRLKNFSGIAHFSWWQWEDRIKHIENVGHALQKAQGKRGLSQILNYNEYLSLTHRFNHRPPCYFVKD